MSRDVLLNKIGFPKIAELSDQAELPGIGQRITLQTANNNSDDFEVTEVKKDLSKDRIYIYVNSVK